MNPDYYSILGVPRNASLEEIKKAYRAKAMQCHPDRGGSHARMLEINEAFEILSDAARRKEYDDAWAQPNNLIIQKAAKEAGRTAREHAGNYPRDWTTFEKWLEALYHDMNAAQFERGFSIWGAGLHLPKSSPSFTGELAILVGALVGILFWYCFIRQPLPPAPPSRGLFDVRTDNIGIEWWLTSFLGGGSSRNKLMVLGFCISGGAWMGVHLHRFATNAMAPHTKMGAPPPLPQVRIIQCATCSQLLRIPLLEKRLNITCPSCKSTFYHDASSP